MRSTTTRVVHVGRSWNGHLREDECPCPQQPCGLVATDEIDPQCPEHSFRAAKTLRQGHAAHGCPYLP